MAKKNVEKVLQLFEGRPEFQALCESSQKKYAALYRQLLEAETIPEAEIVRRFGNVKPLVRLRKRNDRYGTAMEPECMDDRCKVTGGNKKDDLLVWGITGNLNENFVKEFGPSTVLRYGQGILKVGELRKLAEFTVYSSPYRIASGEPLANVRTAEVLRQLPAEVSPNGQYAFELNLPSENRYVYDELLQHQAVPVILYEVVGGYSPAIAKIKTICRPIEPAVF